MYNNLYNPYMVYPSRQDESKNIDEQINRLQQLKNQLNQPQQPTAINQTFQLAPSSPSTLKYANTIDDVKREIVFGDTAFFSKDLTVMWLKNNKGEVRTYELNEIIPKDEKDIYIATLESKLKEMDEEIKEMKENAKSNIKHDDESIKDEESSSISVPRTSKKK